MLSKSKYAKILFDPGVLPFALYATAVDIGDRDATRKKLMYQEVVSARPNDKATMERSFRTFDRSSVELLQLQELGSARGTSPARMQYNAGIVIFTNYSDISQEWSKLWKEGAPIMPPMLQMMQTISDEIQKLPDLRPYRPPEFPLGLTRQSHPSTATEQPPQLHRHMCGQFARSGSCTYGDKCKFSHAQAMVNMVQPDEIDQQVQLLQGSMKDVYGMPDFEGAEGSDGQKGIRFCI